MKAYLYDEQGYFNGEIECQLNPIQSEKQGKDVYLQPTNSTDKVPPVAKEGFDIKFVNNNWIYEEIILPTETVLTDSYERIGPTEPDNSPKGKLEAAIMAKQGQIAQLDYIGIKIATGRATVNDYKDEIEMMKSIASEIKDLQSQLQALKNDGILPFECKASEIIPFGQEESTTE